MYGGGLIIKSKSLILSSKWGNSIASLMIDNAQRGEKLN